MDRADAEPLAEEAINDLVRDGFLVVIKNDKGEELVGLGDGVKERMEKFEAMRPFKSEEEELRARFILFPELFSPEQRRKLILCEVVREALTKSGGITVGEVIRKSEPRCRAAGIPWDEDAMNEALSEMYDDDLIQIAEQH